RHSREDERRGLADAGSIRDGAACGYDAEDGRRVWCHRDALQSVSLDESSGPFFGTCSIAGIALAESPGKPAYRGTGILPDGGRKAATGPTANGPADGAVALVHFMRRDGIRRERDTEPYADVQLPL